MKNLIWLFLLTACVVPDSGSPRHEVVTLTEDGAWCWFSGPRAIYRHGGGNSLVTGWVTSDGTIETATLDLHSGKALRDTLAAQLDKDDHANPAFVETGKGDLLAFYTKHTDEFIRVHTSKPTEAKFGEVQMVDPFSDEELAKYPTRRTTYANPFSLKQENDRIYCFGRWTGFKPNVMWSDDGGKLFTTSRVLITHTPFDPGNRPYIRYFSDGESKIHMVFTDGHPRNEPFNSVYYVFYENGAFHRADGTKICDLDQLPFEPKDATLVYQATKKSGRAWVYDIAADAKGNPVILYARYPTEKDHLYHYASYDGNEWADHEICHAGKWFPQTPEGKVEPEPHYSAAMAIHTLNTNTIYVSREINGVFEIEKRITRDRGKTWEVFPITQNSTFDNVRPVFPRNMREGDPEVVLWMENERYVHYTDFKSRVKYSKLTIP